MLKRWKPVLFLLIPLMWSGIAVESNAQEVQEPFWTHAFDLAYRKLGETDFKDEQKFGVESFKDPNTGDGICLSQVGSFGVGPGYGGIVRALAKSKDAKIIAGLDLACRLAGNTMFDKNAKVYALEIFQDQNTNNFLYITANGELAVTSGKGSVLGGAKDPTWSHSVDLGVRKGGVVDWKDARKYGIEVYVDNNTGNLIYASENGKIAVVPSSGPAPKEGKAPSWLHGLDLKCRKSTEKDFKKDTQVFGVEVFRDEVNGNLIYICETGSIAVLPAPQKKLEAPTAKVVEPRWTHGLNLKCRAFGMIEFDKARAYGFEIFEDVNTGATVYINEIGNIAVIPTKKG